MTSLLMMMLCSISLQAQDAFNWPYKIENATIVTEVPQRPAGQQNALNLTTPKLKVVRVGFVGLGMRGLCVILRLTSFIKTSPPLSSKSTCLRFCNAKIKI